MSSTRRTGTPRSTPHFEKDGGIWPVHCVAGTWGAELHPDLRVEGPVVRKGINGEDGYSGFTHARPRDAARRKPTELEDLLDAAGVTSLVIAGLATDYCVLATGIDARARDYPTTVLAAGIRAVDLDEAMVSGRWRSCGWPVPSSMRARPDLTRRHGRGRGALDCPP